MRLILNCISSVPTPLVNTAIFLTKDNKEVIIDRDETEYWNEYNKETGTYKVRMLWKNCYIWNGEDENYNISKKFINNLDSLVELELEEDCDEFTCKVQAYYIEQ